MDTQIRKLIRRENRRQGLTVELIASENFVSDEVLFAQGSKLTNKYAEGYPGKRYYGGCQHIDQIEQIAINRAKDLFGAEHANVQPHSGSQANAAVFLALLKPGDKVLAMSLNDGGHLTHGHGLNFSGKLYNFIHYGVDKETELIDYEQLEKLADEHEPKLIIAGASAYSRLIDYERIAKIAREVGAFFMVDMAHVAGLVAAKVIPSPVPYADVVTSTTHKTLRGPRGGLILCKENLAKDIDRALFPGTQGGPLEHIIAAKAVCFKEAMDPKFVEYSQQVIKNTQALANAMEGVRIVSGGTDNHLFLADLTGLGITGKEAEELLDSIGITCNKNMIPFDTQKPHVTSGIRLGAAAMTTKKFDEQDFARVGRIIVMAIDKRNDKDLLKLYKKEIKKIVLGVDYRRAKKYAAQKRDQLKDFVDKTKKNMKDRKEIRDAKKLLKLEKKEVE
jgi:glycine hydroxymethyltransferase